MENNMSEEEMHAEYAVMYDRTIAKADKAVESGNVQAIKGVAFFLRNGRTMKEDNMEAAFPYYQIAADKGDIESANAVAHYLIDIGNDALALKYVRQVADSGDAKHQYLCALMYLPQNKPLAKHYLKAAALQNNSYAQYELALMMWEKGEQTKSGDDFNEAQHWFACAYLNQNSDAIKTLNESGLINDNTFQRQIKAVQKYGLNPENYTWRLSAGEVYFTGKNDVEHTQSQTETRTTSSNSSSKSGGCYIATAVYGSYDCPEVWVLRRFRDYTLANSALGRAFIRGYYAVSPTLVKLFGDTSIFQRVGRSVLNRFVSALQKNWVSDTPYQDE